MSTVGPSFQPTCSFILLMKVGSGGSVKDTLLFRDMGCSTGWMRYGLKAMVGECQLQAPAVFVLRFALLRLQMS